MSTTITDVDELQAMENDLDEDYVLGNNIDASATSSWNGGDGFDPIGNDTTTYYAYIYPISDTSQSGSWSTYPDDGVYYTKVDELYDSPDDAATYLIQNGANCKVIFGSSTISAEIPEDAIDISVSVYVRAREVSPNTNELQAVIKIGDTEYLSGSPWNLTSTSYRNHSWTWTTNPSTSSAWTRVEASGDVSNYGIYCGTGNGTLHITQAYIRVNYDREVRFTGTFDGAGYTISDLYIDRSSEDDVGLFGVTAGATIQDVTLTDVDITGAEDVGALIADARGTTATDCHSSGTVSSADAYNSYAGGLIGYTTYDDSTDCTITQCSSSCTVDGSDDIGGLVGDATYADITESYATGDVSGEDYVGGFVGEADEYTSITDCYARGDVTGTEAAGDVGGFISDNEATITNCFSTGAVTGGTDPAGFCYYNDGTITDCFWDKTTSGQSSSDGGTGYATATMLLFATYYDATWDIGQADADRNDGYPYLGWETDDTEFTWYIFGEGTWDTYGDTFSFPDLLDYKGRPVKNAVIDAIRTDVHSEPYIVETQRTDANGTADFTLLPVGINIVFHARWGGIHTRRDEEWFFLRVNEIEDGGTGSGTVSGGRDNLGLGTSDSPQFAAINLGHASDTTLERVSASTISIESKNLIRMATQIIAANDSYIKTQADGICDGTDD